MKDDFFEQYPYLCDTFRINSDTTIEEGEVEAVDLFSPYRLDFMAKLLQIEAADGNYKQSLADKVYEEHLLAFSRWLEEPGQTEKKGIESYLHAFKEICAAIKNTDKTLIELGNPIPIDGKHMAMDGAHRICAAAYYGKKVPVYQVHKEIPNKYDFLFFRKRHLDEVYILELVKKYVLMRECRLYLLNEVQGYSKLKKRIYRKCAPVYMKRISSGEVYIIIDRTWMKQYGDENMAEELLGTHFIDGAKAILNCLESEEAELTKQSRLYKQRKRIGIRHRKCWEYMKKSMKQLLGKPI